MKIPLLPQLGSHPLFPHLLPVLALERDGVGYSFESGLAVEASSCPLPKYSKYHHIVPATALTTSVVERLSAGISWHVCLCVPTRKALVEGTTEEYPT